MSKLYVLSGPSGAGLGEIVTALFARRKDLCTVTPITARKMKAGEVDGEGFYFYDLAGKAAEGEYARGCLPLCGTLGGGAEGPL